MDCIKCNLRPAKKNSNFCIKCEPEPCLTWYKFKKERLLNKTRLNILTIIDDELLFYEYYQWDPEHFSPTLCWEDGGFKKNYDLMKSYFNEIYFHILRERLSSIAGTNIIEEGYLEVVESTFIRFWENVNSLLRRFHDDINPTSSGYINPILILLKKVLIDVQLKNVERYPDHLTKIIDNASSVFIRGSALFYLELYYQLFDENLIDDFQSELEMMDYETARDIILKPKILLVPWSHQIKGYENWSKNGHQGIIEMATSTGKTLIGMIAINELYKSNSKLKVRILTHSRAILNQWRSEVIEKMGILTPIDRDYTIPITVNDLEIHFNTIQSVMKDPQSYPCDLLIVDEVHHGAAPEFRKALTLPAKYKMGLSATIEGRMKLEELYPLLGPKVFSYSIHKAQEDGILPKFQWKVHSVYLSIKELSEFEDITNKIAKSFMTIKNDTDLIRKLSDNRMEYLEDIHDFIQLTEYCRMRKKDIPDNWKQLQGMILSRRWIIHRSKPKLDRAIILARRYHDNHKVIIFTMDIESCNEIEKSLKSSCTNVFMAHSGLKDKDPTDQINKFKAAKNGILIGARMLDEGLDIPDADIGINVASSKTKLQLVQRMGRILRRGEGKKPVFHHYIAITEDNNRIKEDDNLTFLDDLSWVMDTALKMSIDLEIEEDDLTLQKLKKESENMISRKYQKVLGRKQMEYGTLKVNDLLERFDLRALISITNYLNRIGPDKSISDEEWAEIIKKAHDLETNDPINLPGHWWILIMADRNSGKLRKILGDYLDSNTDKGTIDESDIPEIQDIQLMNRNFDEFESDGEHSYIKTTGVTSVKKPLSEKEKRFQKSFEFYKDRMKKLRSISYDSNKPYRRRPDASYKLGDKYDDVNSGKQFGFDSEGNFFKVDKNGRYYIDSTEGVKKLWFVFSKYKPNGGRLNINKEGNILTVIYNKRKDLSYVIFLGNVNDYKLRRNIFT